MVESIFFNPWIWIIPIILGILLVSIGIAIWRSIVSDELWSVLWVISSIIALCLSGAYFGGFLPPYDASFYQTYRITGEINQLERAFDGGSGTMSQTFVLEVDGVDLLISSSDQRLRTYSVGDSINLVCAKEFEYFATPWYKCSVGG